MWNGNNPYVYSDPSGYSVIQDLLSGAMRLIRREPFIEASTSKLENGMVNESGQLTKFGARIVGTMRTMTQSVKTGGLGNVGIGQVGDYAQANELGEMFVGKDANPMSGGKGLVSADGRLTFRFPSFKPELGKVQANFEVKDATGKVVTNGHLDIKPGSGIFITAPQ